MRSSGINKLVTAAVFAVAMGILEAIVAYYLRLLYYPAGFSFPIVFMPEAVSSAEMVREAATMIMLATVAILSGKDNIRRFVMFLYLFGIWDIFYYLGLKVLVGWPDSMFTWDLLFLIPLPWVSPVLAPVICSVFFILTGVTVTSMQEKGKPLSPGLREWLLLIAGVVLIIFTFIADCSELFLKNLEKVRLKETDIKNLIEHYTPDRYRWGVFIAGMILLSASLLLTVLRANRSKKKNESGRQVEKTSSVSIPS
jgi:hypothetical protein